MTLEILLSTMHQSDYSVLENLGLECDAVVVNQCDKDSKTQFEFNGHRILWINSTTRGLSRSRNIALDNASSDICLLADDDEELVNNYPKIVLEAFKRHPDAGIIGFKAEGIESKFKDYSNKECRVGYIRSMHIASVEIALNRNSLIKNKLRFNELIGAGTKYKMGEENTLLFDAMSKGIHVYYVPSLICRIHIGNSTWFSGFNEEYFLARGAVFTAMSRRFAKTLILQFALRKYNLYKSSMTATAALKLMLKGHKEYKHLNQ